MIVDVLVLDGVFDTGLAALQDTLIIAAEVAGPADVAPIVRRVGLRDHATTANGLTVPLQDVDDVGPPDVVVAAALGAKSPQALDAALREPDIARAGQLLRARRDAGATIAAACTGTFVLAECGLLDEHAATTSWWLAPYFRTRYPRVRLDVDRLLVGGDRLLTAGAALAHFDLALRLVHATSPALAAVTARYLLADPRLSQAVYAIPDRLSHEDPVVRRFEAWARAALAERFSLDAAASAVCASRRTLGRRVQAVMGKSPLAYVKDLRVTRAVRLLQSTDDSVESIAAAVGYADGVTLRTLLRRRTGRSASQIRKAAR